MQEIIKYIFITIYISSLIFLVMFFIRRRRTKSKMEVILYTTDKINTETVKIILGSIVALSLYSKINDGPFGLIVLWGVGAFLNLLIIYVIFDLDKPKIYNNGLYCITGEISWEDILKCEWRKSNYANHYTLIFKIKPTEKGKLLFARKISTIEFVFHNSKVDEIDNYISKKLITKHAD